MNAYECQAAQHSRRTVAVVAGLLGMVSLAIGAHAALNKRALDAAKAISAEQAGDATSQPSRLALVIGNGHYPDASEPLAQPINDARALTATLRGSGFDVDVVEDASKDDMQRAIDRLKSRIRPDSVVMLFFGGYGVKAGRESYMIPVDARIWKERDIRREGISVESVLEDIKERGARTKLVVIDASRRNPYERRFRSYSHGLAPINAPDNALILTSATPGKVADDSSGANSVLVSELLNNFNSQSGIESVFHKTRVSISAPPTAPRCPRCRPRWSKKSASAGEAHTGVVPANAGTHTPRPIRRAMPSVAFVTIGPLWLWVPAFRRDDGNIRSPVRLTRLSQPVVPAHAGTHTPRPIRRAMRSVAFVIISPVVMGPCVRRDDSKLSVVSLGRPAKGR